MVKGVKLINIPDIKQDEKFIKIEKSPIKADNPPKRIVKIEEEETP